MGAHGYSLLRESCGRIDTSNLVGFTLRGVDRLEWLQGQATQDLRNLERGKPLSFCLCSPTGQIEAIVDAWSLPDAFWLTCESAYAPALRRRVDEMVILEDVTLEDASLSLLSVQGPTAEEALAAVDQASAGGPTPLCLVSDRNGLGGWDVWAAPETIDDLERRFLAVDPEGYEVARIEAGIPRAGRDVTAKTLPPELGPAFEAAHVSYRKGCYVGQEVLMRIFSQGHTNRTWVGLLAAEPMESGSVVLHGGRAVGGVTSAVVSPALGPIAAATLRHEAAAPGTRVTVQVAGVEVAAEVRPLPLLV